MNSFQRILSLKSSNLVTGLVLAPCLTMLGCAGDLELAAAGDPAALTGDPAQHAEEVGLMEEGVPGSSPFANPAFRADVELFLDAAGDAVTARVTIQDELGEPVSGLTVYGSFSGGTYAALTSVTDDSGVALFDTPAVAHMGAVVFEVDAVSFEQGDQVVMVIPDGELQATGIGTSPGTGEGIGTSPGDGDELGATGIGTSPGDDELGSTGIGTSPIEPGPGSTGIGTSPGEGDELGSTGIGTSPGDDELGSTGIGTSPSPEPGATGIGTSPSPEPGVTGIGTSPSPEPGATGIGTSPIEPGPGATGIGTSPGDDELGSTGIGTSPVEGEGIGTSP